MARTDLAERPLAGRVAVVTGAGRGIGRAIARGVADAGAAVVCVARTQGEIETVADEIREAGGDACASRVDVTSARDVAALADLVARRFGRLHVLVNNAGLRMDAVPEASAYPYRARFLDLAIEDWDRMIATDLRGPFLCCRLLGPLLRAAGAEGGASVVNVSAGAGIRGEPGRTPYSAAKFGLEGLTRSLSAEWRDLNIAVNAVEPGVSVLTDAAKLALRTRDPSARFAKPEVMVPATVWLATQDASGLTGAHVSAYAWLEERGLADWSRWEAKG